MQNNLLPGLIFAYLYFLYWCLGFCLYLIIMQLTVAVKCISESFVKISISLDRQSLHILTVDMHLKSIHDLDLESLEQNPQVD